MGSIPASRATPPGIPKTDQVACGLLAPEHHVFIFFLSARIALKTCYSFKHLFRLFLRDGKFLLQLRNTFLLAASSRPRKKGAHVTDEHESFIFKMLKFLASFAVGGVTPCSMTE
ncbi:hypothetical protein [Massilia sp. BHUDP2]|uniref:hypothetical protein n=1 Tax=Massilia sp. BHUDP2 TaxID=3034505 RepID=UPI00390582DF